MGMHFCLTRQSNGSTNDCLVEIPHLIYYAANSSSAKLSLHTHVLKQKGIIQNLEKNDTHHLENLFRNIAQLVETYQWKQVAVLKEKPKDLWQFRNNLNLGETK